MKRHLLIKSSLAAIGFLMAAQTLVQGQVPYSPVALTPGSYNYSMVVPAGTVQALPYCVNAFTGSGTCLTCDNTFYEQGVAFQIFQKTNDGAANSGLPLQNTVFTNVNNSNMTFLMPPNYGTNDDLMVTTNTDYGTNASGDLFLTNGIFTFVTPTTATNLAILCMDGNGDMTVDYTVTHLDGTLETNTLSMHDWFDGGATVAWGANGRISFNPLPTLNNFSKDNIGNTNVPYLYANTITVSNGSPVVSISFDNPSGGAVANFFAISGNASGPTWTPIPVTGFNTMTIVPAAIPYPVTATMDDGTNLLAPGNTWFEQGYDRGEPTYGLPPSGSTFASAAQANDTYTMANYSGNDAILIDATQTSANITPVTAAAYSAFSFLTSGGNGGGVNTCIVQHADGVNETNTYTVYDWFNGTQPPAWIAQGRVDMTTRTLENLGGGTGGDPRLFEAFIILTNRTSPVTNIVINFLSGGNGSDTCILAVSAAGADVLAPILTSQPTNIVILAGSNVTLSVSAVGFGPLTYQWYGPEPAGNTPPLNPIANATNSTLTISSADGANAGAYFVVVTDANGLTTTSGNNNPSDNSEGGALVNVITSPLSGTYFSTVVSLNPLGYWPLNETNPAPAWPAFATNLGSLGTNADAIYSGYIVYQSSLPDQTNGDNSVYGDGKSTQIVTPYESAFATVPCTFEGWYNPYESFNGGEALMSDGDPANPLGLPSTGFAIYAGLDGEAGNGTSDFELVTSIGVGTSNGVSIDVTNIPPSQWHQVAVTIALNSASNSPATGYITTFYIDGTNVGSGISDFAPNADAPFVIGCIADNPGFGNYNYIGGMDQMSFYPSALSAATIKAHYQAGTNATASPSYSSLVLASSPLLYYELNEAQPNFPGQDSGPVANNFGSTGANDNGVYLAGTFPGSVPGPSLTGMPSGNVAVAFNHFYWVPGGPTTAGAYNGTGIGNTGLAGYVDVPLDQFNSLDITGPVTLAAWVQPTPDDGNRFETFVGRGDNSYRMDVDGTSDDLLHFAYGGAGDLDGKSPQGNLTNNTWHFVVGVWDTTNQYLYIDGSLNNFAGATGVPAGSNYDFTIGEAPDDTGRVFDGNIAHVAIFPYALSSNQVLSLLYSANVPPRITQQPPATQAIGGTSSGSITMQAIGTPNLTYQWLVAGEPVSGPEYSGQNTDTLTINNATSAYDGSYSVVVSNAYGFVTSSVTVLTVVLTPFIAPTLAATNRFLLGNAITLSVGEVGDPPFTNAWYLNGVLLTNGGEISGATTTTLTISNAQQSDVGTYEFTVTNAYGFASSSGYVIVDSEPTFDENGAGWTLTNNQVDLGQGAIANNVITMTDGAGSETTAWWYDTPLYIHAFKASWTYQDVGSTGASNATADGFTFCIQNSAAGATDLQTGGGGSGLAYYQLTNSIALCTELYDNGDYPTSVPLDTGGIDIATNGQGSAGVLTGGFIYGLTPPVVIISGHPINYSVYYDGNNYSVKLTDATTSGTFSTNYVVGPIWESNILNSDTAYIGFTAATGGAVSTQTIGNFSFVPIVPLTITNVSGVWTISWPTGIGGYELQESSSISSTNWAAVPGPYTVVGSEYQYTVSPSTTEFYRLVVTP
jgi:hypothetical protein